MLAHTDVLCYLVFHLLFLLQLGPKAEDVEKPVNPFTFIFRFVMGTICASYYVLVPIYMWMKDQIVPKDQPI
jgi:MPBQ/MSBQ methyltransferase